MNESTADNNDNQRSKMTRRRAILALVSLPAVITTFLLPTQGRSLRGTWTITHNGRLVARGSNPIVTEGRSNTLWATHMFDKPITVSNGDEMRIVYHIERKQNRLLSWFARRG